MNSEIVFAERGAALATRGPLVIVVTDGPDAFAPDLAQRAVDAIRELRRTSHKDRLVYVYLAGERSGMPSAEAREITATMSSLIDQVVGVHEGSGFRASAIRAVVTGLTMIARGNVKPEIVATTTEAGALLATKNPDLGPARDIAQAIEATRRAARATA